jgi:hypothetical protein
MEVCEGVLAAAKDRLIKGECIVSDELCDRIFAKWLSTGHHRTRLGKEYREGYHDDELEFGLDVFPKSAKVLITAMGEEVTSIVTKRIAAQKKSAAIKQTMANMTMVKGVFAKVDAAMKGCAGVRWRTIEEFKARDEESKTDPGEAALHYVDLLCVRALAKLHSKCDEARGCLATLERSKTTSSDPAKEWPTIESACDRTVMESVTVREETINTVRTTYYPKMSVNHIIKLRDFFSWIQFFCMFTKTMAP